MTLYIIFDKKPDGQGFCKGFTSMQGVSEFTGIKYNTLLNHFTREKRRWHYYKDKSVEVIKVDNIQKGHQRVIKGVTGHNRKMDI